MSTTLLAIPHYNDTERLKPFLSELLGTLPSRFVLVVSDDGSVLEERNRLSSMVDSLRPKERESGPILLPPLFTDHNTGKGGAVIRGWGLSSGHNLVAFADADGAVSASEILRAEEHMRSPDCLAGALYASRVTMLGRKVERSLRRHISGRVFATLVSELSGVPVFDSQCGLKIIRQTTLDTVLPYLSVQGFSFDVELLLLLLKSGCLVEEFPVDWYDVPGSKVSLFKDSLKMIRQVLQINRRLKLLGPIDAIPVK